MTPSVLDLVYVALLAVGRPIYDSRTRKIEAGTIDEVKVRTFGDFAVVTGKTTAAGSYRGTSLSVTLRFTDVCVKRGSDWQVVASQATLIA